MNPLQEQKELKAEMGSSPKPIEGIDPRHTKNPYPRITKNPSSVPEGAKQKNKLPPAKKKGKTEFNWKQTTLIFP